MKDDDFLTQIGVPVDEDCLRRMVRALNMSKPDPTQIKKSRIAVNSLSSIALRILSLTFLTWLHRHLLGHVDEDEYSLLPLVMVMFAVAPTLLELLAGGIARYVTEAAALYDKERIVRITSSMVPLMWAATGLFLVVSALLVWRLDLFIKIPDGHEARLQMMAAVLVVGFAFEFLTFPYQVGLQAHQEFVKLNFIQLGQELLRMTLIFLFLTLISVKVHWVLIATVIAQIGAASLRTFFSRRALPELRFERGMGSKETCKEILSFSGWSSLGSIAEMFKNAAPALVLNRFSDSAAMTSWHIGSIVYRQLQSLVSMASVPLQPVLTILHARKDEEAMGRIYLRMGRYLLWLSVAAAVPLFLLAEPIVTLYVPEKNRLLAPTIAGVMRLMVCQFPFVYASVMLYRVVIAKAQLRGFFLLALAAQFVAAGAMALVVWYLGKGAVAAATATLIVTAGFHIFGFWPMGLMRAGVTAREFLVEALFFGLLPGMVSLALGLALINRLPTGTWTEIALFGAIVCTCYLVVACFAMRSEDRRDFKQLINTVRARLTQAKA